MNRKSVTLILILVFIISSVFVVKSIYMRPYVPVCTPIAVPAVEISYPLVSTGGYVNSSVDFTVTVNTFVDSPALNGISYSLDGGQQVNLSDLRVTTYSDYGPSKLDFKEYKANISFEGLSEGNHTVTASAIGMSANRSFEVNSNYHITALKVLSPTSPTYTSDEVPLKFTYTGEITNAHYYLYKDGKLVSEKSLSGDTTLDNLSDGSYQLLLFVTTQYGQDSKMMYFFIISVPTIVVAAVLLIMSLSIALLFYFKKIKKKKD
jgi:hypothetical protein